MTDNQQEQPISFYKEPYGLRPETAPNTKPGAPPYYVVQKNGLDTICMNVQLPTVLPNHIGNSYDRAYPTCNTRCPRCNIIAQLVKNPQADPGKAEQTTPDDTVEQLCIEISCGAFPLVMSLSGVVLKDDDREAHSGSGKLVSL